MIKIYKSSSENNTSLKVLDNIENGCWINIIAPSNEELILIYEDTMKNLSQYMDRFYVKLFSLQAHPLLYINVQLALFLLFLVFVFSVFIPYSTSSTS